MRTTKPCWNATAGSAAERGRKMVTSGAVTSTQTSLPLDGGDGDLCHQLAINCLPLVMMVVVVMMLTHIMKQWHDKSGYKRNTCAS